MKFELKPFNRNVPDEELLADLKRMAKILNKDSFSTREYDKHGGKFRSNTISIRFKGWNNGLEKAGLLMSMLQNIPENELFENLEKVWIELGAQPVSRDMKQSLSKYSAAPYLKKFGSWRKALEAFVLYINSNVEPEQEIEESISSYIKEDTIYKHKTKRQPSERLKVQVLMRDGNKCKLCGITITGEDIHFDHIKPWSKGGETVLENMQVLCATHNLAKGDLDYPVNEERN
jgi:5-methylcytosine-specific restriction endonuclease McrA